MNERAYTNDRNTQILLALLKEHGIKRVIASPGTTNIALVASMQYDSWFELYSSVDERSAAYMACGMSDATGEPVVLTCTGATASRNYLPGLTEAYYRKLPILVISGSHGEDIIGHLHAQSLDRTQAPKDTVGFSTVIKLNDSDWKVTEEANRAILELYRRGGGPVHIDLESAAYGSFNCKELPCVRKISRYHVNDDLPSLANKRVAIFIGSHNLFKSEEIEFIETFCEKYNSVVFVDHTSGYYGKYALHYALVASQKHYYGKELKPDVLIHIGEISGEFYCSYNFDSMETWRISVDGEIRDRFNNLTSVFEMSEGEFFRKYNKTEDARGISYYCECRNQYDNLLKLVPELPFGNIWIAQSLHNIIPQNSELFFSIFNSLRSWNFFELPEGVKAHCNVGGFGIDGTLSTMLGASLVEKDKLFFSVVGDLAFFYDMNSLGNRHLGNNIRILLINNGIGTEFKNYDHPGSKWGTLADLYIAAGGHFGNKSKDLVKHYGEDLGFKYISATCKDEFKLAAKEFLSTEVIDKPILFEVFTDSESESNALRAIRGIMADERSFKEKTEYYCNAIKRRIFE